MNTDFPMAEVAATPEYILEVLRDQHRILIPIREADPIPLEKSTLVSEWEDSLCIESWGSGGFGGAMNAGWGVNISMRDWNAFRTRESTLGELCDLLAPHVRRPVIRSWNHIAGECRSAGAFLTIRSLLVGSGAQADTITPSTPLSLFTEKRWSDVWSRITRITPGVGPVLGHTRIADNLIRVMPFVILFSLVFGMLLVCAGEVSAQFFWIAMILSLAAFAILNHMTLRWEFANPRIQTFRDLSYALIGETPPSRNQRA